MKRALALAGMTLAVAAAAASPAMADDATGCYVPVQYCPAATPTTPTDTAPSTDAPAPAPAPTPAPPTTTEPSTAPTVTPPAPTAAEKKAAAKDAEKAAGGDVSFSAQVGSALVYAIDDAAPAKNGKVKALALTVDPGAKVVATGTVALDNGKTLKLPKFTTTVGKDGQLVITVKLSSSQLKALKKAGTGTISLSIQVTDQYGTHTKTVKVDVTPAKKSKKK